MTLFGRKIWLLLASVSIVLVTIASISWMKADPVAISWDEAVYFNQVIQDVNHFNASGLHGLASALLHEDSIRQPAYRMLSIPFVLVFGFTPTLVRLVNLGFFLITALILFLTARSLAGNDAGAIAAVFFCLCPFVLWCGIVFGTEFPFFLSVAATLYFLFLNWNKEGEVPYSWMGLGISLGLGALSKLTFLLFGGTVVAFAFILSWRKIIMNPRPAFLIKASFLGAILCSPWWILHYRAYIAYAHYAMTFVRHSWNMALPERIYAFFVASSENQLGPPLTILLILMISAFVFSRISGRDTGINHTQKTAIWVCLVPLVLFPLVQFTGDNMNLRYFTFSMIPLAVIVGVLSQSASWRQFRFAPGICGALFIAQLIMIFVPTVYPVVYPLNPAPMIDKAPWLVMARLEQWDLDPVRQLCNKYGIRSPSISYLGNARNFNPAQIEYTWLAHGGDVDVKWLWRYEDGPVDMDRIVKSVDRSDVVLTVLNYKGMLLDKQDRDNRYDNDFATRLGHDTRFIGPFHIRVGRFDPVDMVVFLNAAVSAVPKK